MTKAARAMKTTLGAILALALLTAPRSAEAIITPLHAPKTSATYHLAPKDPPVNVILLGWYCTNADLWIEIADMYVAVQKEYEVSGERASRKEAFRIAIKLKRMKPPGWPFVAPSMHVSPLMPDPSQRLTEPRKTMQGSPLKKGLDAPPGVRKVYRFKHCYTRSDLLKVRKIFMTWVHAAWDPKFSRKKGLAAKKTILGWGVLRRFLHRGGKYRFRKLVPWLNSIKRRFPYDHTIIVTVIRDGVFSRRMTIKPVWQPKDKSAGGRKRESDGGPFRQLRIKPLKRSDRKKGCNYYAAYDDCSACGADEICLQVNIKNRPYLNCVECEPKEQSLGKTGRKNSRRTAVTSGKKGRKTVEQARRSESGARRAPRKRTAGCRFSKPRIVGSGKPGLAGFPEDFPHPPGIGTTWIFPTATGRIYNIGISGGWRSTVRFVKKALPAQGWRITGTKTTHNPGARTDSVHFFFRNKVYCGWVTIGTGKPMPTYMNVFLKKRRGRVGGG